MAILGLIIILGKITEFQHSYFGIMGGTVLQSSKTTSDSWPIIGSLMEITMPGLPSFSIRGNTVVSWDKHPSPDSGWYVRNIALFFSSVYTKKFPLSPLEIYIGGGPEIHLYNWENIGTNEVSYCSKEANWVGLHILGGIRYEMLDFPLGIYGEVGYGKEIGKEKDLLGLGKLSQIIFTAGIRVH
ncbi:MAG: hypothetical protein HY769_04600 [Candidatus Stahlbacteria bacterium]|nr:hypothetical protein [Candidatus Stahlbacteria bacterium]